MYEQANTRLSNCRLILAFTSLLSGCALPVGQADEKTDLRGSWLCGTSHIQYRLHETGVENACMTPKNRGICRDTILAILLSTTAGAASGADRTITLMQLSDVHGHIAPHASIFTDGSADPR